MSFMSKKLKVKSALLAGVVILSLLIMGVILSSMQDDISLDNYRADIQREMDELPGLLQTADDEAAQTKKPTTRFINRKRKALRLWLTTIPAMRQLTLRCASIAICFWWITS